MEIPEYVKKALQDAQELANSPEYRRAVQESIELMSHNKIDIDLMIKIAHENSKYIDYNIRNTIDSIEYIKKDIPDLEIKKISGAHLPQVLFKISISHWKT